MAITRCPYCHAIIDENDKYCNNCGTQLLFADDEQIEEEIPGEKIVDAPVEEKDYTVDEPEERALDELVAEEARKAGEDDVTEEVILVDELEASEAGAKDGSRALEGEPAAGAKIPELGAGEAEDEDDEEDDEESDEEVEEEEAGDEPADELEEEEEEEEDKGKLEEEKPGPPPHKEEETREYRAALENEAPVEKEPVPPVAAEEEPGVEYLVENVPPDDSATAGEGSLRPVTFDSKELEDLGKTVELSKQKVDEFLEVMGERTAPAPPSPQAPAASPSPPAEAGPDLTPPIPPTGSLPPWASTMKGAPVFEDETGPVETRKLRGGEPATSDTEDEVEIFPKRQHADSTIGLPEKVGQAPLPFEAPASGEGEEEEDEEEEGEAEEAEDAGRRDLTPEQVVLPAGQVRAIRESVLPARESGPGAPSRTDAEAPAEAEEPGLQPPFSFSVFFKSKSFDVLFVGLFWLVALWLAASTMGVTLFAILGTMSGSMLLLYAVFVFLYFFLFKFFLGETLGDRLFRPRE